MRVTTLYLLFCVALLSSCFKDVSYKTNYILRPQLQLASGDVTTPLEGVKAYAFAADTTSWGVASYEDAEAGILTSKHDPAKTLSTPIATAEPYQKDGSVGWLSMTIARESQMVLVVDTANKLYAYTQQKLGINLPELYVAISFRIWKTGKSYKDGAWQYFNHSYTPPVYVDLLINATSQAIEAGPTIAINDVKAYAFVADTTEWYIASYDNALKGIITSKTNPKHTRTSPDFTGFVTADATRYRIAVSSPELMVVMVDKVDNLYAYSRQVVDMASESTTVPLIFQLWNTSYISIQDSWRVVNDSHKPTEPAPTSLR